MSKKTTIKIDSAIKEELSSLKVHHRETYEDVIIRLIAHFKQNE